MPKTYRFECTKCDQPVAIDHGDVYSCPCGWSGRYPERIEQLELTTTETNRQD
jgi:hypothetical protein